LRACDSRLRGPVASACGHSLGCMKTSLYIVGAVVELSGVVLVASPDLVPGALRFAAWARPRLRRIENRARRLLRARPRAVVIQAQATGVTRASGHASATVSTSVQTLEEKVEFLLRRDAEAQSSMNQLGQRVGSLEETLEREVASVREHLEDRIEDRITEAHRDFQTARFFGVAALAVGLGLSTAGNLVR
jgi:hypothetical protein